MIPRIEEKHVYKRSLWVPWAQGPGLLRRETPVPWAQGPGPMGPRSRSHGPKVPVPWAQGPGPMVPRSRSHGPGPMVPWARAQGPSELVIKGLYAIFCSYMLIKSKYLENVFDAVIIKVLVKHIVYVSGIFLYI